MTPEEYVRDLCDPGVLVGALYVQAEEDARLHGWNQEFLDAVKRLIMERYKENAKTRLVFPKKPRYL
jgi:hypothetical protein